MKITPDMYEVADDGCWLWLGELMRSGHSRYPTELWQYVSAHKISYEQANGPVPSGLVLDHACHSRSDCALTSDCPHRRCINPDHLRAITQSKNIRLRYTRELDNA